MNGASFDVRPGLPAIIASLDEQPIEVLVGEREMLHELLRGQGAVLLRGFHIDPVDVGQFATFVSAISGVPLPYVERSSPRHAVQGRIYTSTEHPPSQPIFLHNEQSYNLTFPARLHFWCRQPAHRGGATTLVDARRVLEHVPDDLRDRLVALGYRLTRHLRQEIGLPWQQVFQTDDRAVAEEYAALNDIELSWLPDDEARVVQCRDVVARHPDTAEMTWFNHCAFFHVSSVGPANAELLRSTFGPDALPTHTSFGDGSPLTDDDCERLRQAYLRGAIEVRWRAGDVLIIDNLLVGHGRAVFEGARDLVVAMTGATSWSQVRVP